ncbi:phytoene desaturase family protein [Streptomyces antimicrobicus]|uniref:NAD(P)/FAD-dependent oxidoreductase n=1 Tax=Streptomyces antimicrobicus TaxID=2883108 RepID=A0ABS8BBJ9_9ACTN|nr:NAD(P)/FAD-dependent oxidoreductase [Streptomyces antimicrobicus]MCB5181997.1 NAD(P)/FAD-dependent oxidoreductase [Streptomyces antimicrobicus]
MAPDAVIVGTGPNGLTAGATLARAGLSVELYEAGATIGGGLRTESLFDSDIQHDICAAVHPMALASPFFKAFGLQERGVEMLHAPASYAHPLPGGAAGIAYHDLDATQAGLGPDGRRWRRLMRPLLQHSDGIVDLLLSDQRSLPRDPVAALLLARRVLAHGTHLASATFETEEAKALLTGVAAHAVGRLPSLTAGAVSMLLGHLAHGTGWPVPRGGSARIADALTAEITAHGGTFHTGRRISDLAELPRSRAVLLDVSPKTLVRITAGRLPTRYRRALARYTYGPGAAKADFLITEPVPWTNQAVGQATTVHLGGTQADIFRSETTTAAGVLADEPFVLVVDPVVADPERARPGKYPLWAYAHVPNGDTTDPIELITSQIERYAPGFRDTVIAQRGTSAAQYEEYNPNYVGGDIGTGAMTIRQSLLRPAPRTNPYRVPLPSVYLCSAATPPGPGVHGMSGYYAALAALHHEFGIRGRPSLGPVRDFGSTTRADMAP